ncbi:MBL fold metallo-hydrolase [Microbacterium sp. RD1]|uniref:MBL fold metallo-hydrolase n=1 Tax=Microbacterium sp. RD1 TaxID=3457313 RepID=UPI003FA5A037
MTDEDARGLTALALAMEIPGARPRSSWAYLLEDAAGGLHLIDCGADTDANAQTLENAVRDRGRSVADIATVTVTHAHFDHAGMALRIQAASSARLHVGAADADVMREHRTYAGADLDDLLDRWGVPGDQHGTLRPAAGRRVAPGELPRIDRDLRDGDDLEIPGWSLRVLATPGHTPGSLCVTDVDRGIAFVGDHVLAGQNPAPGLGGPVASNPVSDYLQSLERLAALSPRVLHPGHGDTINEPAGRIGALRRHHARRREDVGRASADGAATVWDVARRLPWSGGWDALDGVRRFSALIQVDAHLDALRTEGRGR